MTRTGAIRTLWPLALLAMRLACGLSAAAPLPAPPSRYVADNAGVLGPAARDALNARLDRFERDTSSQLVVWVERKLPENAALEEHVNAVFRHWKIGQARTNNGILLAVFVDDRRLRIEVGRGLEGALPDALAGRIIREQIQPRFRSGDYEGGLRAGVESIIAATRGEYRGTGGTVAGARQRGAQQLMGLVCPLLMIAVFVFSFINAIRRARRRGWAYSSGGWNSGGWGGGGWNIGGGGWGGGGGGGGGSDSGGGFSGGGGDSGGGGASGSW